jgi:hypothetical protein
VVHDSVIEGLVQYLLKYGAIHAALLPHSTRPSTVAPSRTGSSTSGPRGISVSAWQGAVPA